MTTKEISTLAHAHTCVWQRTVYRFRVGGITAERLADPAFARVLVQVHAISASHPQSRPAATLYVMASLHQPTRIPLLLTDALRQHLATTGADRCAAHRRATRPDSGVGAVAAIAA